MADAWEGKLGRSQLSDGKNIREDRELSLGGGVHQSLGLFTGKMYVLWCTMWLAIIGEYSSQSSLNIDLCWQPLPGRRGGGEGGGGRGGGGRGLKGNREGAAEGRLCSEYCIG